MALVQLPRATIGDPIETLDWINNLGEVLMLMGNLDAAKEHLDDSVAIARSIGSRSAELEGRRRLLELRLERGHAPAKLAPVAMLASSRVSV